MTGFRGSLRIGIVEGGMKCALCRAAQRSGPSGAEGSAQRGALRGEGAGGV